MYQTQLLKIRIRPGKTERVVEFLQTLMERREESLEALRNEGMMVESMFLEKRDEADYLYYYVKAKDLAAATEANMRSTDPLTLEIRKFVSETWGDVSSPEPLLDIDLIDEANVKKPEATKPASSPAPASDAVTKPRVRRSPKAKAAGNKSSSAGGPVPPHTLAGA